MMLLQDLRSRSVSRSDPMVVATRHPAAGDLAPAREPEEEAAETAAEEARCFQRGDWYSAVPRFQLESDPANVDHLTRVRKDDVVVDA
jgi:hypothetical protein